MERTLVRLQSIKHDTESQVNEHYRAGVQLEEQIDDNRWKLLFCKGVVKGLSELEPFFNDGDLSQVLMRLQSLRIEVYCSLSDHFRKHVTLQETFDHTTQELHYQRGIASLNGSSPKIAQCYQQLWELKETRKANEKDIHFCRGFINGLDEIERIINEELNPKPIASRVSTSPGLVGPDFEGQAMVKQDKVEFPVYPGENPLSYVPEYEPGKFARVDKQEVQL